MWNKFKMIMALSAACMFLVLTGCSDNINNSPADTVQQMEAVSEIDSFSMSVDMVKTHYDKNEMYKGQVIEAANQAMIMEGFFNEMPHLYEDTEYKGRIDEIYNIVKSMDMNKEGLLIEEGSETYFFSLDHVVERMYNRFNNVQ